MGILMAETIQDIPLEIIFSDSEFNVRGSIVPFDVIELAKDIQDNGLINPIQVQPYKDDGFQYKIVCGHRRHLAYKVNNEKTIPCIVKKGLTEEQAIILNVRENVSRKNLNIMQEAEAIKRLKARKLTLEQISKTLKVSKGWVQIRDMALKLPDEVQREVAAGFITQEQIKDLSVIRSKDQLFEAVKQIKEAKFRNEKKPILKKNKKPQDVVSKKKRNESEIFEMIGTIIEACGTCLATRALAWASGEISSIELFRDLHEYCEQSGYVFNPPEGIKL